MREGVLHSFNVESVHCVTSVQIGHRRRESFPEKGTSRMKRESMVKLKKIEKKAEGGVAEMVEETIKSIRKQKIRQIRS